MLLAQIVSTADAVGATSSRNAKVALLADLLRRLEPGEVVAAVGYLSGWPRQGRIGVGWARLFSVEVEHAARPSLSVEDLDTALSRIQATVGKGSSSERARLITELFQRGTAAEADFIRRLLVGEMRQGALEGVVTEAVARAAEIPAVSLRRAAMLSGDLGAAAEVALREGEKGLAAIGLVVLRPVQPMLASTAESVAEAIRAIGPASVEWKLDGIRVQVHRSGDDVRVFTRNLNDVTERVPEIVEMARRLPVSAVVLDGETIGLDSSERPHLFQETMSRVGRRSGEPELTLAASFFDVLHADGEDLLDRPLSERIDVLEGVVGGWRIPATVTDDVATAERFLDDAIAAGHEGVMVKALSSTYQAGRRGGSWLKVKPVRTLDLVVIAVEWGHGRRRGWLSNLHLGARGPSGDFVMVGKTFKGLTDQLLRWQTEELLSRETSREGIVVRVRPELVVEIGLDGVQASPRYPGGVALRFARVLRYRPDKTPAEADTIEAVRALLPR